MPPYPCKKCGELAEVSMNPGATMWDGLCDECRAKEKLERAGHQEKQEEKKYIIPVPAYTDPNNLGVLVKEALQKRYSVTISSGTAGSITMAAVDAVKEKKMELKEVELRLGPSWLGFTIKWGK